MVTVLNATILNPVPFFSMNRTIKQGVKCSRETKGGASTPQPSLRFRDVMPDVIARAKVGRADPAEPLEKPLSKVYWEIPCSGLEPIHASPGANFLADITSLDFDQHRRDQTDNSDTSSVALRSGCSSLTYLKDPEIRMEGAFAYHLLSLSKLSVTCIGSITFLYFTNFTEFRSFILLRA